VRPVSAKAAHVVLRKRRTTREIEESGERVVPYQEPLPSALLYVPEAQSVHGPPAEPPEPATHRHCDSSELPTGLAEFAGQEMQPVAEPGRTL
jgi:hypothetical protein